MAAEEKSSTAIVNTQKDARNTSFLIQTILSAPESHRILPSPAHARQPKLPPHSLPQARGLYRR